jgi:multisubunit Na+/H+ antiporter MnhE subunit
VTSKLLRVAALTAVYLLVLTSLHPGDILIGLLLSAVLVAGPRHLREPDWPVRPPGTSVASRLAGIPALVGGTLVDIARGTWQVVDYCLAPRRWPQPGLVSVPIRPHGPSSAAAWGIRVGLAPDTVVVDVDEEQGLLLLHVLDAGDPNAVRTAQLDSYRRRQRRVFP